VGVEVGVGVAVGASAVWVAKMLAAISVASALRFSSAEVQAPKATAMSKPSRTWAAVRFMCGFSFPLENAKG
jgi:hypothetical protein